MVPVFLPLHLKFIPAVTVEICFGISISLQIVIPEISLKFIISTYVVKTNMLY